MSTKFVRAVIILAAIGLLLAIAFGITIPIIRFSLDLIDTNLFYNVILGIAAIVGISVITGLVDWQICKTAYKRFIAI